VVLGASWHLAILSSLKHWQWFMNLSKVELFKHLNDALMANAAAE